MKKLLKGFILGVIFTTLLMSTAFGVPVSKVIEVVYNSVNITVNGKNIGADNILYNGTTYVPLRAIAEILDKEVTWEQSTMTASINDKGVNNPSPIQKPISSSNETLSQKNAVDMAKSYLNYTAFSRSGLIHQLEFEGFSNEEATYAVNKLNIDWKEQAVKMAKSYLDYTSFSRSGLIHQLEFEGFSSEEATYAVNQIGL